MLKRPGKPIKICMVVNQIYYTDTRVISYANALIEAGAHVDVISSRQAEGASLNPKPGITIYPIPLAKSKDRGVGYIVNYLLFILLSMVYTAFLHLKNGYDVIHIHNMPDTLILAALLPKLLGAKVILDIHDPMPNMFMSKFRKDADSSIVKFLKVQERLSAKLAEEVITANPIFKEELSARGIPVEKITVINNIPDPKIFDPQGIQKLNQNAEDKITLIYPGTIASRYSLDIPIRALPALKEKIPNIQLKIIGKENDYVDELNALAADLDVTDNVIFSSHLPASQVALEMAKADIGIYTPIPDAHMNIAMPGKVLEYVIMGIPVVASRLRILEFFFTDASISFFTPGNINEFCSHIERLYRSPFLREELVENANEAFTRRFSWKKEFEQYTGMINKLLNSMR